MRRKGKKFILEKKINGKVKYLLTLPPPDKLYELLKSLYEQTTGKSLDFFEQKKSQNTPINEEKQQQTFGYYLLNETLGTEKKPNEQEKRKLTEEEKKTLWELTK